MEKSYKANETCEGKMLYAFVSHYISDRNAFNTEVYQ